MRQDSGREKFDRYSGIVKFYCILLSIIPKFLRSILWDASRPFGGIIALSTRYALLKCDAISVGKAVYIGRNVTILNSNLISIGNNVSIHENSYIDAKGGCKIGSNVSIAHASSILTFDHTWDDHENPIKYNPITIANVEIDDDVWIGAGVRILRGVKIGTRSIIAAGAVVRSDVSDWSIYGGVPAKKIKVLNELP